MTTRRLVATAALIMLSMTAHAQTRPPAPTLTANGAIIIATWDEQPGDGYYVGVAERGRGNWRIANVITDPTDTEQSIQLYGAKEYAVRYRVRELSSNGNVVDTPWSTTAYKETWPLPGPPTSVAVDESDRSLTFSWEPPTRTGCESIVDPDPDYPCAIMGYTTQWREASPQGVWSTLNTSPSTWRRVTGLKNGTEYVFRIRAYTRAGAGERADHRGTPAAPDGSGPPGQVRRLGAQADDGRIILSWAPPADSGGSAVTGYTVQHTPRGGGWRNAPMADTGGTQVTLSFLENDTEYAVRVRAKNADGNGPWSGTVYAEPKGDPDNPVSKPRNLVLWPEDGTVTAYWAAPAEGTAHAFDLQHGPTGGPYTTVRDLAAEDYIHSDSNGYEISNLTNGTEYSVRVRSVGFDNVRHDRNWTDWKATTPGGIPDAPANVRAETHGDGQVLLTWNEPADNGRPIVTYVIEDRVSGQSEWRESWKLETGIDLTNTARVVAGLESGTLYEFRVAAWNAIVTEDTRNWSSTVSARSGVPVEPPRNIAIEADPDDDSMWTVTWDAPTDAEHVEGYRVQWARAGGGWNQGSRSGHYDVGTDTMTQTVELPESGNFVRYAIRVGSRTTVYEYGGGGAVKHRMAATQYTPGALTGATTPVPALPLGFLPIGVGVVAWAAWRKRRRQRC